MPEGLFITFCYVVSFGPGDIITSVSVAILIYLLVEHPTRRIFEWTFLSRLSRDTELHAELAQQQKIRKLVATDSTSSGAQTGHLTEGKYASKISTNNYD